MIHDYHCLYKSISIYYTNNKYLVDIKRWRYSTLFQGSNHIKSSKKILLLLDNPRTLFTHVLSHVDFYLKKKHHDYEIQITT